MLIGLDIDEVLINTLDAFLEYYNKIFLKDYKREEFHVYEWWDIFESTREECLNIYYDYMTTTYAKNARIQKDSFEGVRELKKEHDLVAVTSRPLDFKDHTFEEINRNYPDLIRDIYFTNTFSKDGESVKKSDIVQREGIELLVEDWLVHARDCAPYCRVILLDTPWNQCKDSELPDNTVRAYGWKDILRKV